jgi:hypothetical protein
MVTARMMAIAAGYEDADDLDALRHDPQQRGRGPPAIRHLASDSPHRRRNLPSLPWHQRSAPL